MLNAIVVVRRSNGNALRSGRAPVYYQLRLLLALHTAPFINAEVVVHDNHAASNLWHNGLLNSIDYYQLLWLLPADAFRVRLARIYIAIVVMYDGLLVVDSRAFHRNACLSLVERRGVFASQRPCILGATALRPIVRLVVILLPTLRNISLRVADGHYGSFLTFLDLILVSGRAVHSRFIVTITIFSLSKEPILGICVLEVRLSTLRSRWLTTCRPDSLLFMRC